MTRTKEQIAQELNANAPQWLKRWGLAQAMFLAAARVLAWLEVKIEALRRQSFRLLADEPFLENIGQENGIERIPGESIEDFRARAYVQPQGVAPDLLREEINRIVENYVGPGFEVKLFEPLQVFSDFNAFSDDPQTITPPGPAEARPKNLFWLLVPRLPVQSNEFCAFSDLAFSDGSFIGDDDFSASTRLINRMILDWAKTHRVSGVPFGVTVQDTIQQPHINLLFDGGFLIDIY